MEGKIISIIKTLILFILLIFFKYIFIAIIPFNYNNMSIIGKGIVMFIADLIYLIGIVSLYNKTLKKDFKNYFKHFLTNFEQSFKYYLVGLGIMILSNIIIVIFIKGAVAGNEEAVREMISKVPIYMIFSVSIYAPLTEELIFRKSIRDIIDNKYIYIITSGILFALAHVATHISSVLDILYIIPYASLGITFAYTYYKTKNIFSSIILHSIHNSVAIILYLIAGV